MEGKIETFDMSEELEKENVEYERKNRKNIKVTVVEELKHKVMADKTATMVVKIYPELIVEKTMKGFEETENFTDKELERLKENRSKNTQKVIISVAFLKKALQIIGKTSEAVEIEVANDYPIILKSRNEANDNTEVVIAPRIRND